MSAGFVQRSTGLGGTSSVGRKFKLHNPMRLALPPKRYRIGLHARARPESWMVPGGKREVFAACQKIAPELCSCHVPPGSSFAGASQRSGLITGP